MSVKVVTKTKKSASTTKQQFVRLNLDASLEEMLKEYEVEYRLLNRSDIIRMLLSQIYWAKKQQARRKVLNLLESLPIPSVKMEDQEIFNFLEENDLM